MSAETPQFRDKERPALEQQLESASVYAQAYLGYPLLPSRSDAESGIWSKETLIDAPEELLKLPYGRRMEIYRRIIHSQRSGKDLSPEEKEKHSRWLKVLHNLDNYIVTHQNDEESRVLFDRQFSVFEDLRNFLEEGETEGYVKLPTGAGKTVLFTKFAESTRLRTLVVTPTKILVDQTDEQFDKFTEVETGKIYTYTKEYGRQVTITTYQSFLMGVENETINPADYDLLILDEAHKSLTKRRIEAVRQFENAVKIGFTATPKYSPSKELRNLLPYEIHTMSIQEAVREGMMSPFFVYIAKTNVDLSEVRISRSSDANDRDLDRAVNITSRNQGAVEVYKQLFAGEKAVVYCVSIEHAKRVAEMFRESGVNAETVFGGQNRAEQRGIIEGYRSGEISVVCNADILVEGFDEPSSSVCINLRPTASPLFAEQRAGRVLRIDPNNPGKHAYIVDFIDEFENANFIPVSMAQIIHGVHVYREGNELPEGYRPTGYGTPHYPFLQIEGLKVMTDVEEIMSLVKEMTAKKYSDAREGWLSLTAMRLRFRLHPTLLKKLLDPFRETHPEYFELTRGQTRKTVERYSPELVEHIAMLRSQMIPPIEGWISMNVLANELGVTRETVMRRADVLRKRNDSQFRLFRKSTGQIVEHVSPVLAEALREELKIGQAPEGWLDCKKVAELLGIRAGNIHNIIARNFNQLLLSDSTMIRCETGKMRRYISPNLINKIREKLRSSVSAPDGWIATSNLAKELGISKPTLNKLIKDYRTTHPHFFEFYISDQGGVAEYCSPNLAEFARNKTPYIEAEEGWVTIPTLARQLGMFPDTAKRILDLYRITHNEHFRPFRIKAKHSGGGLVHEHISPDLATLIIKDKRNLPGKVGWRYQFEMVKEFATSEKGLNKFIEKFRQTNPEYFELARGPRNRLIEYYSPELVEQIREHFGKKERRKKTTK